MEQYIKPRRWWQFSDKWRIQRRLNKMKDGGRLLFSQGVYKISKTLTIGNNGTKLDGSFMEGVWDTEKRHMLERE